MINRVSQFLLLFFIFYFDVFVRLILTSYYHGKNKNEKALLLANTSLLHVRFKSEKIHALLKSFREVNQSKRVKIDPGTPPDCLEKLRESMIRS